MRGEMEREKWSTESEAAECPSNMHQEYSDAFEAAEPLPSSILAINIYEY